MSAEGARELQLEIGQVLFIDIVGYSKLLSNEQTELLEHLKRWCAGRNKSARRRRKGN